MNVNRRRFLGSASGLILTSAGIPRLGRADASRLQSGTPVTIDWAAHYSPAIASPHIWAEYCNPLMTAGWRTNGLGVLHYDYSQPPSGGAEPYYPFEISGAPLTLYSAMLIPPAEPMLPAHLDVHIYGYVSAGEAQSANHDLIERSLGKDDVTDLGPIAVAGPSACWTRIVDDEMCPDGGDCLPVIHHYAISAIDRIVCKLDAMTIGEQLPANFDSAPEMVRLNRVAHEWVATAPVFSGSLFADRTTAEIDSLWRLSWPVQIEGLAGISIGWERFLSVDYSSVSGPAGMLGSISAVDADATNVFSTYVNFPDVAFTGEMRSRFFSNQSAANAFMIEYSEEIPQGEGADLHAMESDGLPAGVRGRFLLNQRHAGASLPGYEVLGVEPCCVPSVTLFEQTNERGVSEIDPASEIYRALELAAFDLYKQFVSASPHEPGPIGRKVTAPEILADISFEKTHG